MKSSELRIGNYLYDDEGNLCKVARIETPEYTLWNSGESFSIIALIVGSADDYIYHRQDNNWRPIPLTEEWLLKFGFEKKWDSLFYIGIGKIRVDLPNINCEFYPKGRIYFNYWAIKDECVQYVHQLQNLYFALTGEELEFKQ